MLTVFCRATKYGTDGPNWCDRDAKFVLKEIEVIIGTVKTIHDSVIIDCFCPLQICRQSIASLLEGLFWEFYTV